MRNLPSSSNPDANVMPGRRGFKALGSGQFENGWIVGPPVDGLGRSAVEHHPADHWSTLAAESNLGRLAWLHLDRHPARTTRFARS